MWRSHDEFKKKFTHPCIWNKISQTNDNLQIYTSFSLIQAAADPEPH